MRCAETRTSVPSSTALRQRDAPLQLPGLRAPPAAPRASERLLLHGSARGGAAAPALGPARPCAALLSGRVGAGGGRGGRGGAGERAAPRWYVPPPARPSSAALPAGGRCRKCRHFGVFCSGGSGRGGGGGTRRLPRDSASAARRRRLRRRRQQLRQRQAQVQPLVSAAAAG